MPWRCAIRARAGAAAARGDAGASDAGDLQPPGARHCTRRGRRARSRGRRAHRRGAGVRAPAALLILATGLPLIACWARVPRPVLQGTAFSIPFGLIWILKTGCSCGRASPSSRATRILGGAGAGGRDARGARCRRPAGAAGTRRPPDRPAALGMRGSRSHCCWACAAWHRALASPAPSRFALRPRWPTMAGGMPTACAAAPTAATSGAASGC